MPMQTILQRWFIHMQIECKKEPENKIKHPVVNNFSTATVALGLNILERKRFNDIELKTCQEQLKANRIENQKLIERIAYCKKVKEEMRVKLMPRRNRNSLKNTL